ncbi:MAG: hypothetical protein ACP5P3_03240 [Ignavibacteria bacterium]
MGIKQFTYYSLAFSLLFLLFSCENIFAPAIDNSISGIVISDQKSIDGVFINFKYAYTFKDTSVYSNLLTDDFVFTFRNYESGYDESWDKPTEMRTTARLFENTQKLEVIWNNTILDIGDSLQRNIKRSFNLTITFNPSNIVRLNGFADMNLRRTTTNDQWRISKWKDETF